MNNDKQQSNNDQKPVHVWRWIDHLGRMWHTASIDGERFASHYILDEAIAAVRNKENEFSKNA